MNATTLWLCDNCGEVVEMPEGQRHALERYELLLGERVVVHCSSCFAEINGLNS